MRSEHYLHPEFGCFAPGTRLRREVRVAVWSMLFGLGIGTVAMIALGAGTHTANDGPATRTIVTTAVPAPPPQLEARGEAAPNSKNPESTNTDGSARPSGHEAEATNPGAPSSESASSLAGRPEEAKCGSGNSSCTPQPSRSLRLRAANEGPELARVALGRAGPPTEASARPDVASEQLPEQTTTSPSRKPEPEQASSRKPEPEQASSRQANSIVSSELSPEDTTAKFQAQRGAQASHGQAGSKHASSERQMKPARHASREKTQNIARSHPRQVATYDYGWRGDREYWVDRDYDNRVGRAYARDNSFTRRGFWDWSW